MPNRPPLHQPHGRTHDADYNKQRRADPRRRLVEGWRASRRWAKVRRLKLSHDPLCEPCRDRGDTTPAQQVHHIVGALKRPDLFWAWDNLMSVCTKCHAEIERNARG